MNRFPYYKFINLRFLGLLLVTVATPLFINAQEPDKDDIDLLLDELFFNEQEFMDDLLDALVPKSFLYTGLSYNSNTYFTGRDVGLTQYNIVPQVTYYHKSGISLGISGMHYETYDPHWDFTTFTVSYYKALGKSKQVYINGGYSKYLYSDGSDIFTNTLDMTIGLKNKKMTLGTALTVSYLFGGDSALQLVSTTQAKIPLIKENKFSLKLKPKINVLVAQQTIALETLQGEGLELIYNNYDVFDLFNTQLQIPLALTTYHWNIDLGYVINIPNAVASETKLDPTEYFSISFGYLIDAK